MMHGQKTIKPTYYFEMKSRLHYPVLVIEPDLKYNLAHIVALISDLKNEERPLPATRSLIQSCNARLDAADHCAGGGIIYDEQQCRPLYSR
jgi:hypothetical protein